MTYLSNSVRFLNVLHHKAYFFESLAFSQLFKSVGCLPLTYAVYKCIRERCGGVNGSKGGKLEQRANWCTEDNLLW